MSVARGLSPSRRAKARSDARQIAAFLKQQGASRVVGIGSAFVPELPFTWRSDVDLAVAGLPVGSFFSVSAQAEELTKSTSTSILIESTTESMRCTTREDRVAL